MNLRNEIWRNYPLNLGFEVDFRIEFSNLGRMRSFSKANKNGNIIKGSLQAGFPIFRATFFDALLPKDEEKLQVIRDRISELNAEIKIMVKTGVAEKRKEYFPEKIKSLRTERDLLIKKHKKFNGKYRKKVANYFAVLVHRAVADLFLEKPENEERQFIIHKDFNKLNNKADNLAWATQEELSARQNKHPIVVMRKFREQFLDEKPTRKSIKLTKSDVLHIKEKLKKNNTLKSIAKQFNVSDMQIYRIKTGENWAWLKTVSEMKEESMENKKWQAT